MFSDVVYIGTVHPFHLTLGKLALDNGKHVLCEKPLGVNTRETMELIGIARKKNLFLMEVSVHFTQVKGKLEVLVHFWFCF